MRQRNLIFGSKPATLTAARSSGHRSKSSSAPASLLLNLKNSHTNALVALLSVCILLWIFLCFHIHLHLSGQPLALRTTSLGLRRRSSINLDHATTERAATAAAASTEGLSACLLVNDENPRLPEWIAYHYQILPLRSLIVAVDPASRSSPAEILDRWESLDMGLDAQIWEEKRYMPYGGDGACNASDPHVDCLKHHRNRQQHFVRRCMADFKQRNKTWVLLTDVDEYITFNVKHDYDPPPPLDFAPNGEPTIPTIANWTWSVRGYMDMHGKRVDETTVNGIIMGLPQEGWHGKKNGEPKTTLPLTNTIDEIFYGAYGSIFTDEARNKYFLRDDHVFRDAFDVPLEDVPSWNVPVIKGSFFAEDGILRGTIYNDTKREDGESVEIPTNWKKSPVEIKTIHGGHMMNDLHGQRYYVERDNYLLPPHLSTMELLDIRKRLPTVDSGKTVLDVLTTEMQRLSPQYANETMGPCLAMPRMLYGSWDDSTDASWKSLAPEGFQDQDFVTLRYRWHSLPDTRVNKYQKTLIDMSRIPKQRLKGEAENIHTPVKYYCRQKQPPRYTTSFFRVNHYLDSFEAYSYRNDARADKRNCKRCYDEKGNEATRLFDDDIRPWLKKFVESVGQEKAKILLAGAGNFVHLS